MNAPGRTPRLTSLTGSRVGASLLALALAAASSAANAALVVSDFELDADGWIGLSCPNPGVCALGAAALGPENFGHVAAGGNPGGYIDTVDPDSATAGRAQAPAWYLGHLVVGLTLSFDALITDPDGTGAFDAAVAPLVTVEGAGMTLVYSVTAADFPVIDGPWKHYAVPLAPGAGWNAFLNSDPEGTLEAASAADFAAVFGSPDRLTLIAEWLQDEADLDTGGIDNVQIVPLPAALPLLLGALAGLAACGPRHGRGAPTA